MTAGQFERLLSLLERIANTLERLVPGADAAGSPRVADAAGEAAQAPASEGVPAVAAEPVTLVPESLRRFLDSRGIRVRRVPPPHPADPVLDQLALYLGQRYEALKDVLGWIKRTMQTGGNWHLKLAGRPQEVIGACCQFCHRLHQLAFLTDYRYHRAPRCLIEARTSTAPEAQNFFSGQWLERFVRQQVEAAGATSNGAAVLANAQVVLSNNDDFELDLLVEFQGTICWIESKTGPYQQYVRKYSQMARMLGLGARQSFLVLAGVAPGVCEELSRLTQMTVCRPEEFYDLFLAAAGQRTGSQAASL
ncbi:MAG: hypothetical protein ACP5UT_06680 [Bryobacteraceae bacterium]